MRNLILNLGYFFKEARRIIKTNIISNVFAFLGTTLVLILLALAVAGWSISTRLVEMLEKESEVSAFFHDDIDTISLTEKINLLDGVLSARVIDQTEAYDRMKQVLSNEASVLELFDENPFDSYVEIRINPGKIDNVVENLNTIDQIDYVRDNKEVLERLGSLINAVNALAFLVIIAVGITTVIIISHMIRQGIYNNKDQIKALRFLGASNTFIGFPFICVGLLITISAGVLASAITIIIVNYFYGFIGSTIAFIPLPAKNELILMVTIVLMGVSIILGLLGSFSSLSSTTKKSSPLN